MTTIYSRIVLKLSGESLGTETASLDSQSMRDAVKDIAELHELGVGITIVVGGGNLFRGNRAHLWGLKGDSADEVGMVATGLNALLIAGMLADIGINAEVFSRGPCVGFGRAYRPTDLRDALNDGSVVLLAGGMGVSGISTDVAAVQSASDVNADAVIMSKYGTDGVYTADPRRAEKYELLETLTASFALEHDLKVMDKQALAWAIDHRVPIHVVAAGLRSAARQVIEGERIGSVIFPE